VQRTINVTNLQLPTIASNERSLSPLMTAGAATATPSNASLGQLNFQDLLLLCLQSRDGLLWAEFIRRSQPLIAGVVVKTVRRWTTPSPALVDDLVQDTYVKLWANNLGALRQFVCRHENALFGFLKVVAANTVQDYFRCSYSQKRGCGKDEEDLDQATIRGVAGCSEDVERGILLREIDNYLQMCAAGPNHARDCAIFWLYYRQGLTAKQISQLGDINLTVKGVESMVLRLTRLIKFKMTQ
jgi:RNA polymerase sigma-70 factor (ECF subfamily)